MAVQGVFTSDSHIVGNRVGDFASSLLQIHPTGSAPLLALSAGMESQAAQDVMVVWFEENHITGRAQILSFVTDGDGTGFVVDDASQYVPGAILLEEERSEYVLVTAVNVSTNTITVTRNIDGAGSTTFVANDYFQKIGTAYEESSDKPTAMVNLGYTVFNYTQIFRNLWDVSGTAQAVQYHTGSAVAKSRADCALFHSEDIERSMWWGSKAIGTLNGNPFRLMDGLYSLIATNVTTAGATTSYAQLDTFFKDVFSKNIKGKPNERIAFTGNLGIQVLNEITLATSQMNIVPGVTEFGLQVFRWITPYGTVSLMTHPLMTESPFWTGDLAVLHPGAMRTRWLRRTMIDNYNADGTRAGRDADYGVYTSELTMEYRAEVTAGLYRAMQDGA